MKSESSKLAVSLLRSTIREVLQQGQSRLPSAAQMASSARVSHVTMLKALHSMVKQGYLVAAMLFLLPGRDCRP